LVSVPRNKLDPPRQTGVLSNVVIPFSPILPAFISPFSPVRESGVYHYVGGRRRQARTDCVLVAATRSPYATPTTSPNVEGERVESCAGALSLNSHFCSLALSLQPLRGFNCGRRSLETPLHPRCSRGETALSLLVSSNGYNNKSVIEQVKHVACQGNVDGNPQNHRENERNEAVATENIGGVAQK